jgi:uncharacterized phosphatase
MESTIPDKFIYFVRHGQSAANLEPVFQGPDDPLTELGRKQAACAAEYLAQVHAEVILTSPMPRARETAGIIQGVCTLPLEEHTLFREYRPPSSLSGRPKDLPEGKAFLEGQREHFEDPVWHFEDEDNYHDLHTRAVEALTHLEQRAEQNMIVVTHAGFMRTLLVAMMTGGQPNPTLANQFMRFLKPQNTGITLCRYRAHPTARNPWRLLSWNNYEHLTKGGVADEVLADLTTSLTSEDI